MEPKTNVVAENNRQEIIITRDFDLSVGILFKAHIDPAIVARWMGTKVIKLEGRRHGSYQFETIDPNGNRHGFNGTIHEFVENRKITRTFEMENSSFPVQLEFLEFESLGESASRLRMHLVFRSVTDRDNLLKLPFAQGINMAHDRLERIAGGLNQ